MMGRLASRKMSISFLRMQWRSSTWVVSVFRCLVSLVCQCRAICCRLRPLESTTRLSKSHLSGLVPGKKLESELHAIRLFPFQLQVLSYFHLFFFFFFFFWSFIWTNDDDDDDDGGWWFSFFFFSNDAWRTKCMSKVREISEPMIDERWIHDAWPCFLSVVWSLSRRHSHPSNTCNVDDNEQQHTRHIHRCLADY